MCTSTIITIVAVLAAVASAIYAVRTVSMMKRQMQQFTAHELTRFSNEHNWNLYVRHGELPPALPCWRGLSDKGWAWRILHLNHLNLIALAYIDHQRDLLSTKEFEGWTRMAKFWFSDFWSETRDADIREGCETLRQLLKPEEGYSNEFRQYLLNSEIIPQDLFSD